MDTSKDNLYVGIVNERYGLDVDEADLIQNGHNSRVYRLSTKIGGLVLRLQPLSRSRFGVEKIAIERFHETDKALYPEVLHVDTLHHGTAELAYSIERLMPGMGLDRFLASSELLC